MKKKSYEKIRFRFLLIILLFLCSFRLFSGNYPGITKEGEKKDLYNQEWQLYKEFTGIQVFYRSVECHDIQNGIHQQRLLMKFVNTTDTDLKICWNMQLWYNDLCLTCEDINGEYIYNKIIKGGNSDEGSCETQDSMNFFIRFLNYEEPPRLTNFEIAGLTVTPM